MANEKVSDNRYTNIEKQVDFNTNKRESQGFPKACKWWYKNLIGIET